MNDSSLNPVSMYALPIQDQDLALFETANDLPQTHTVVTFDLERINQAIAVQARQAQLQSDAHSALLLATLFRDDAHRHLEHLERAEAAAFALGQISYQRGRSAQQPFTDIALATAWNNGYNDAARQDVVVPPQNDIEARLWDEGIDTETGASQYALAAVALLRLADVSAQAKLRARAQRLAQEMLAYQDGQVPTPRRQQEIDRFLQLQTQRLAASLDFSGL